MMQLALSILAGLLLGTLFFGGLYWTVRKAFASSTPALWFITSLLLRSGMTLTGFYVVANGDWQRLAAALTGFIIARLIITRLTTPEADHAPELR